MNPDVSKFNQCFSSPYSSNFMKIRL